jgi:hypothetical protein
LRSPQDSRRDPPRRVRLPSRMAKRDFSLIATGLSSTTASTALSPGITMSTPPAGTSGNAIKSPRRRCSPSTPAGSR